jgi:hypothetical protein
MSTFPFTTGNAMSMEICSNTIQITMRITLSKRERRRTRKVSRKCPANENMVGRKEKRPRK